MTHKRVGKLIGTLRAGSVCVEPPLWLKGKGVVFIAVHPDEQPQLVTPWGITPLTLIPDPPDPAKFNPTHSISAGTARPEGSDGVRQDAG